MLIEKQALDILTEAVTTGSSKVGHIELTYNDGTFHLGKYLTVSYGLTIQSFLPEHHRNKLLGTVGALIHPLWEYSSDLRLPDVIKNGFDSSHVPLLNKFLRVDCSDILIHTDPWIHYVPALLNSTDTSVLITYELEIIVIRATQRAIQFTSLTKLTECTWTTSIRKLGDIMTYTGALPRCFVGDPLFSLREDDEFVTATLTTAGNVELIGTGAQKPLQLTPPVTFRLSDGKVYFRDTSALSGFTNPLVPQTFLSSCLSNV